MHIQTRAQTDKIRALNDFFRQNILFPGENRIVVSAAVNNLDPISRRILLIELTRFNDFHKEDNDPHYEHDLGIIRINGQKLMWKIDYYAKDSDLQHGSEDPSDPTKTTRVMTICMLEEY